MRTTVQGYRVKFSEVQVTPACFNKLSNSNERREAGVKKKAAYKNANN